MTTEHNDSRHRRMMSAVRELADAVPIHQPSTADLLGTARPRSAAGLRDTAGLLGAAGPRDAGRSGRRRSGWLVPVLAAAAVLVVAAVNLLPAMLPVPAHQPAAGQPVLLPQLFATHSYLTAHVSDAPAGPAVALYAYGIGDSPWQTPQVITVGVDGRSYRELDAAADRATPSGDPLRWPMSAHRLLAPDGTKVAVEDGRGPTNDIMIVDLSTGEPHSFAVPAGSMLQLLAWSPDSRRLVYTINPYPQYGEYEPRLQLARDGELFVLDVTSGKHTQVPGVRGAVDAAFSPDGARLAVQKDFDLVIVEAGGALTEIDVADRFRLGGPAAWTPDGELVMYQLYDTMGGPLSLARDFWGGSAQGLRLLDVSTGEFSTDTVETSTQGLLGWRGDDMLLRGGDAIGPTIVALPFGGAQQVLARLQPGDDHHIDDLQLATALTGQLQVVDDGVDRGPWPIKLRVTVIGLVAVVATVVTLLIRRRDRRAGPPPIAR